MKNKNIFLVIFCIFVLRLLHSQDDNVHSFINFNSKDGLTDKYIYCAQQDSDGYMWFGTGNGLCRYDGHSFEYFHSPLDKPAQNTSDLLNAICLDNEGVLWLGAYTDLQWFNTRTHRFTRPSMSDKIANQMIFAKIHNVNNGENGKIWIGTYYKYFYLYDKKNSAFKHFNKFPISASKNTIKVIEFKNLVFAIHPEGIYSFNLKSDFIGFYPIFGDMITNCLLEKKSQKLILTTYKSGIIFFDLSKSKFDYSYWANNTLRQNCIFAIYVDKNENFYLGSYSLIFIDNKKRKVKNFSKSTNNFYSLGAEKIVYFYSDRESNLWICSQYGLSLLPWQNDQIKQINLTDTISKNIVEPLGIFNIAGGTKYFITNTSTSGLIYYDKLRKKTGTIKNPQSEKAKPKSFKGLIITPDNKMFVSDDSYIFELDTKKLSLKNIGLKDQNNEPLKFIRKSLIDPKDKKIFISTRNNGFYIWNYPSAAIKHINIWDVDKNQIRSSENNLVPLLIDRERNVWFTGNKGLYVYETKTDKYINLSRKFKEPIPYLNKITDMTMDNRGHIWLVSTSLGLFEIQRHNGKYSIISYDKTIDCEISTNYLYSINYNKIDNSLWISSLNGLIKFDPNKKKVLTTITKQNGLYDEDSGYFSEILPDNNLAILYFGNLNLLGLANYKTNKNLPEIKFNAIEVLNSKVNISLLDFNKPLILNQNENFIQLEFSALIYNNSNRNTYKWMLEGLEKKWINGKNINKVSYSSLRPGKYTFKVKALNNDGFEGPVSKFKFVIKQPFYFTWWFLFLIFSLIALFVFIFNRYRVASIRKDEQLKSGFEKQIAETELKALRAQMNPHFIFNSLNSIQKFILKNESASASDYLIKFSRLIRLILDSSNQSNILLSNEIEMLELYLEIESLRFDNKFDYKIQIEEEIDASIIEIPSMLIQPYVENAVWHGLLHKKSKGLVKIEFRNNGFGVLQVIIEDNGIGRAKAQEIKSKNSRTRNSYGMTFNNDRITILNKLRNTNNSVEIIDILKNGLALGTKVILNITIK